MENLDTSDALLILIGIVVSLAFSYYFLRAVFKVKRRVWTQKQQLQISLLIAEKLGAIKPEEMEAISKQNLGPDSGL